MTRLALVMIAKDEARCIARALESAAPHVDELIVLDTGSSDATREIAAGCGARVERFAWCDDFTAARNAALALSDADWNLLLDADEWLQDGTAALTSLPAAGGFLGCVRVLSETDADAGAAGVAGTWIPRLLPRGVRYEGRIHEQPVSALPHRRVGLTVGHDGYLGAQLERKAGRNEALLMAELERAPQDGYLWFQLAKEYAVRGQPPQASVCFAEAYRLAPEDAPWRHALVVRAITALKTAGQFEDALALVEAEFDHWQTSPDFFYALGDLYLECASREPDRALAEYLPMAEFAWKKCLEIGERPELDGTVAGRGGHMAAHNLAVFYGTLGRKALAAEFEFLAARLKAAA